MALFAHPLLPKASALMVRTYKSDYIPNCRKSIAGVFRPHKIFRYSKALKNGAVNTLCSSLFSILKPRADIISYKDKHAITGNRHAYVNTYFRDHFRLHTSFLLRLIAKPAQPFCHILRRVSHIPLADGKAVFNDRCIRFQLFYRIYCTRKTAPVVNIKRNDRLAGKSYSSKKLYRAWGMSYHHIACPD